MSPDPAATILSYINHSRQYLSNALLALQNDEAGKAGELLWGSVVEALQAVAAYRNRPIRTHRELKNFAIQLARDLNDQTIEKDFIVAESLHHNFYVVQQEPSDIAIVIPTVQQLVTMLLALMPPEAHRQPITA